LGAQSIIMRLHSPKPAMAYFRIPICGARGTGVARSRPASTNVSGGFDGAESAALPTQSALSPHAAVGKDGPFTRRASAYSFTKENCLIHIPAT